MRGNENSKYTTKTAKKKTKTIIDDWVGSRAAETWEPWEPGS